MMLMSEGDGNGAAFFVFLNETLKDDDRTAVRCLLSSPLT